MRCCDNDQAADALSSAIAESAPTGNTDLHQALDNIVANALATTAGSAIGGDSGALSAHLIDRFNRQLHPEEYTSARKYAGIVAQKLGISEQEAEGRIVARNPAQLGQADSGSIRRQT